MSIRNDFGKCVKLLCIDYLFRIYIEWEYYCFNVR